MGIPFAIAAAITVGGRRATAFVQALRRALPCLLGAWLLEMLKGLLVWQGMQAHSPKRQAAPRFAAPFAQGWIATLWLRWLGVALCCMLLWSLPGRVLAQADVLPVPQLTARVIDQTGTLSDTDKEALEAKLADYEKAKGSQIVVLMVPTTQPEDIAAYANRVANAWKIGRRDVGDGVLVIVAKNDRRMRIEVARALEGALPDLTAARIMDDTMKPHFRVNDYAGGLNAAVEQITQVLDGEPLSPVQQTSHSARDVDWTSMLMFLFGMLTIGSSVLKALLGRMLGSLVTGGLIGVAVLQLSGSWVMAALAGMAVFLVSLFVLEMMDGGNGPGGGSGSSRRGRRSGPIVISGSSSDRWDSGSSSGGFSSGGGGSFGGGGASGSW